MAFKMKGSAFKLGNVATKSALQQDTRIIPKAPVREGGPVGPADDPGAPAPSPPIVEEGWSPTNPSGRPPGIGDPYFKEYNMMRKGAEIGGALPMKSPLEQEETPISPVTNKPYPEWVMKKSIEQGRQEAMDNYNDNQRRLADPEMQRTAEMITSEGYGDEESGPKMKSPLEQKKEMKTLRKLKKEHKKELRSTKKDKISKAKEVSSWVSDKSDKRDYVKQEKKAARKEHKEAKKQFKSDYKTAKGLVKSGKAKLKEKL